MQSVKFRNQINNLIKTKAKPKSPINKFSQIQINYWIPKENPKKVAIKTLVKMKEGVKVKEKNRKSSKTLLNNHLVVDINDLMKSWAGEHIRLCIEVLIMILGGRLLGVW